MLLCPPPVSTIPRCVPPHPSAVSHVPTAARGALQCPHISPHIPASPCQIPPRPPSPPRWDVLIMVSPAWCPTVVAPPGPHHCLQTRWALTLPLSQSRKVSPPSPSSSPGWCTWSTQEPAGPGLVRVVTHGWDPKPLPLPCSCPQAVVWSPERGHGAAEQHLSPFRGSPRTAVTFPP